MQHELKTWPSFFFAITDQGKRFELRKNDRDYKEGDTLLLREWLPLTKKYTGKEMTVTVGYIFHGPMFCLPEGFCIMGITPKTDIEPLSANEVDRLEKAWAKYQARRLNQGVDFEAHSELRRALVDNAEKLTALARAALNKPEQKERV